MNRENPHEDEELNSSLRKSSEDFGRYFIFGICIWVAVIAIGIFCFQKIKNILWIVIVGLAVLILIGLLGENRGPKKKTWPRDTDFFK